MNILISVDIQPAYVNSIGFSLYEYAQFINECDYDRVIFLYNGPELGFPDQDEYMNWLIEIGVDEQIVFDSRTKFYDKGYGFFRYAMDSGVEPEHIAQLVKYMASIGCVDSRDMDEDMWDNYCKCGTSIRNILEGAADMINIPCVYDFLSRYAHHNLTLIGGGINECLKEVEIALMAIDKEYDILSRWTY